MTEWIEKNLPSDALVFIDSGGFSAHTMGVPIDLDAYAKWLSTFSYFAAFALDVIGNPIASRDNSLRLRDDYGLVTIPIVHLGSSLSHLSRYLDDGFGFVALGGMVGKSRTYAARFARGAFDLIDGRALVHGLGIGVGAFSQAFPWYSLDSSIMNTPGRFRYFDLFDQQAGRWVNTQPFFPHGERVKLDRDGIKRVWAKDPTARRILTEYGWSWRDLDSLDKADVTRAALAAFQEFQQRRHPVPSPSGVTGPLACMVL